MPADAGCYRVVFTHPAGGSDEDDLAYGVKTPTESIYTTLGTTGTEQYMYCVEDGQLARSPTSSPTVSAQPTSVPSPLAAVWDSSWQFCRPLA